MNGKATCEVVEAQQGNKARGGGPSIELIVTDSGGKENIKDLRKGDRKALLVGGMGEVIRSGGTEFNNSMAVPFFPILFLRLLSLIFQGFLHYFLSLLKYFRWIENNGPFKRT
jgi:hypothetical protein